MRDKVLRVVGYIALFYAFIGVDQAAMDLFGPVAGIVVGWTGIALGLGFGVRWLALRRRRRV